jgi:hypothetical protein
MFSLFLLLSPILCSGLTLIRSYLLLMYLPLVSLLRSYFCSCSFLLLYGSPSSSSFRHFLLTLTSFLPCFFSWRSECSPTSYIRCSILILYFFDGLPSCSCFQLLKVPELLWPLRYGVSVIFLTS